MTNGIRSYVLMALMVIGTASLSYAADSDWRVVLESDVRCDSCTFGKLLTFDAENVAEQKSFRFSVTELSSLVLVKTFDDRAVILGYAGREMENAVIYDLSSNKKIETVGGSNFSLSPSGRYAAFVRFYSWHDPAAHMSDVISLYDFSLAPQKNRVAQHQAHTHSMNAGVPIFPGRNKKEGRIASFDDLNYAVSNIVWSPSGKTLGFVAENTSASERMNKEYNTKAVLFGAVDLSGGIRKAVVYLRSVPIQELLRPEHAKDAGVRFFADDVAINDEGALELHAKTVSQLKPQFSLNLFKDYSEKY